MRVVHVAFSNGVTMLGEGVGGIWLGIDFVADCMCEIVEGVGETTTEDIGHGDVNVADMDPPFMRMNRKPIWK